MVLPRTHLDVLDRNTSRGRVPVNCSQADGKDGHEHGGDPLQSLDGLSAAGGPGRAAQAVVHLGDGPLDGRDGLGGGQGRHEGEGDAGKQQRQRRAPQTPVHGLGRLSGAAQTPQPTQGGEGGDEGDAHGREQRGQDVALQVLGGGDEGGGQRVGGRGVLEDARGDLVGGQAQGGGAGLADGGVGARKAHAKVADADAQVALGQRHEVQVRDARGGAQAAGDDEDEE